MKQNRTNQNIKKKTAKARQAPYNVFVKTIVSLKTLVHDKRVIEGKFELALAWRFK